MNFNCPECGTFVGDISKQTQCWKCRAVLRSLDCAHLIEIIKRVDGEPFHVQPAPKWYYCPECHNRVQIPHPTINEFVKCDKCKVNLRLQDHGRMIEKVKTSVCDVEECPEEG